MDGAKVVIGEVKTAGSEPGKAEPGTKGVQGAEEALRVSGFTAVREISGSGAVEISLGTEAKMLGVEY